VYINNSIVLRYVDRTKSSGWLVKTEKMRTIKIPAIDADGLLVFVFGFLVG